MMKNFKSIVLAIVILLPIFELQAQQLSVKNKKAIAHYSQAVGLYRSMQYNDALYHTNKAIERAPQFVEAYLLQAELYRLKDMPQDEINAYKKVIEIDANYFPYALLNLGTAQWEGGEYLDAIESVNAFLQLEGIKSSSRNKAKKIIELCEQAQVLKDNPVDFNPVDLGAAINNDYSQYWPSLSIDETKMVYTVLLVDSTLRMINGQFKNQEDFYQSTFEDGKWSVGKPLEGNVNTKGNEGAQQLSADGKTLVFTGCNRADGQGKCDIYFSTLTPEGWTVPKNAGLPLNTGYSEKQPSLSPDGRVLFFSSNRPGGFGGMDLWYSVLGKNGKWSRAENMGEKINTLGDDVSPFIHADNQTFYFSSDGHKGLGKKDIFMSRLDTSGQWQTPVNLGYPINTYRDEIGLVVNKTGEQAYYSSNINSNSRNIYTFVMPIEAQPIPVSYAKGKVYDAENNQALKAQLLLIDLSSEDTVMLVTSDSLSGGFLLCLPVQKNFALNVSYPGYLFFSKNFNLSASNTSLNPFKLDVELNPIKKGEYMVLDNVFFEHNAYHLKPESLVELNSVMQFLKLNPNVKLEIGGHTDNSGDEAYNLSLSEKRAQSVYNQLIQYGASEEQLSYKGYGESAPLNSNETKADRAKNRRTEMKVVQVN